MTYKQDVEREAFEKWAVRSGFKMPRYVPEADDYADRITQAGWDAWQAARAQPASVAVVTDDMVRRVEHACPIDLPHLDKMRWKAARLNELLATSQPETAQEGE